MMHFPASDCSQMDQQRSRGSPESLHPIPASKSICPTVLNERLISRYRVSDQSGGWIDASIRKSSNMRIN